METVETTDETVARLRGRVRAVLWLADGRVAVTLRDGTHEIYRLNWTDDQLAAWMAKEGLSPN